MNCGPKVDVVVLDGLRVVVVDSDDPRVDVAVRKVLRRAAVASVVVRGVHRKVMDLGTPVAARRLKPS